MTDDEGYSGRRRDERIIASLIVFGLACLAALAGAAVYWALREVAR